MESKMTITENGTKQWRNENGELHRTDGSAVIWEDGEKWWCQNGKIHREDGPAIILPSGSEMWYQNGQLHREDGPAVIWSDGEKEWWIEGKRYSFQKWANELNLDQKTRLEMVLKWNPQ